MIDHKHFEDMVALYSLGTMESSERLEFEEHLQAGCTVCRDLLRDFKETMNLLPYGLPPAEVPPHLKSQIMEKISGDLFRKNQQLPETQDSGALRWVWDIIFPQVLRYVFTVTLLLILAGTSYYTLSLRSQLDGEIEQGQQVIEALDESTAKIALLRQQVTEQERIVRDLQNQQHEERTNVAALNEELTSRNRELHSTGST